MGILQQRSHESRSCGIVRLRAASAIAKDFHPHLSWLTAKTLVSRRHRAVSGGHPHDRPPSPPFPYPRYFRTAGRGSFCFVHRHYISRYRSGLARRPVIAILRQPSLAGMKPFDVFRCPDKLQPRRVAVYANNIPPTLQCEFDVAMHVQRDRNQVVRNRAIYP